jgi:hypothetical protein
MRRCACRRTLCTSNLACTVAQIEALSPAVGVHSLHSEKAVQGGSGIELQSNDFFPCFYIDRIAGCHLHRRDSGFSASACAEHG